MRKSRFLFSLIVLAGAVSSLFVMGGEWLHAQEEGTQIRVPVLPETPYNYVQIDLPAHLDTPAIRAADTTPADNPVTDAGATLGRVLFYDVNLSANRTVSCASCHVQADGFSDENPVSIGFNFGRTSRNSMGLTNARYYNNGRFFWDERAATLEEQVLLPIQDDVEMGLTLAEMIERVEEAGYYAPLFEDAFGSADVTEERVAMAMAQFVRSMVSYQTKYDEGVQTNFANFTREEDLGRRIFNGPGRCSTCHESDAFIATRARNNGLDATTTDDGVAGVTDRTNDEATFKVPSLRNVALTAPYMHDGRFQTLAEVVTFYNEQVQPHPNLDQQLRQRNGEPRRLNLDAREQAALVAFLHTLTDEALITDEKFADPFVVVNVADPPQTNQIFIPLVNQ